MSDDRAPTLMAPESIGVCPHCRRGEMYGPVYEYVGGHRLRYTCRCCGYAGAINSAAHEKPFQKPDDRPSTTRRMGCTEMMGITQHTEGD